MKGADVSVIYYHTFYHGETALHVALGCGRFIQYSRAKSQIEVVRALLDKGADKEAIDIHQKTSLHVACYGLDIDSIHLLLECGANVHARDALQCTPIMYAVRNDSPNDEFFNRKCIDIVKLLIQYGADEDARNAKGESLLHLAASRHIVLKHLLRDGGPHDINTRTLENATCFHYMFGNLSNSTVDDVKWMVRKGAG